MNRHELREQVFRLLFRVEFHAPEDMPRQIDSYFEDPELSISEKNEEYITKRCELVREKLPEIDRMLSEKSEKWEISRIGKVELAILRLAAYEILFDEDIPDSVAINEAVELAKTYGQESSGAFVNAVLAKFLRDKSVETKEN